MNADARLSNRSKSLAASLVLALATTGTVAAGEETLECRLYMGLATEVADRVEPSFSPVSLGTVRRHALCLFADGRVAEKQFVFIDAAADGGTTGTNVGYSVYGFESGDTLMARFDGSWGEEGYAGDYAILSGTGRFEGASGGGTIRGVQSDWTSTGVVDIVLNVTLPD